MGTFESSFRRLSLRVDRAACLSSWAGSAAEVDDSEFEEWLRYEEEGRVETSDMKGREKKRVDNWDGGQSTYTPGRCRDMPLDGHAFLVNHGWSGAGNGLRKGAISTPVAIPQKRNLAGIGKDRDEAFPFWDQ